MASDASPISHGTIRSNESAGVSRSRAPPVAAAQHARGPETPDPGTLADELGPDAVTEPTLLHTRATVLVTFAVTGPRPTARRAG